ncbi:extracellular solute-binding protein [Paenibacillus prosopidis]|uniref:Carbohydrate ABC transporter substrate-binding protein (CUT1 family) n=1 Tax=Paenibacillus prosopidis TaxID=630520 RepID=A0A368W5E4_9BACL|nr:extracellular solute-binding protein [Paenibacillus prosopidis]RCW49651.1 carbohydrate ABC transporter substrate-binding protein (CUT1 family) [Paenibacillus prosopidis]
MTKRNKWTAAAVAIIAMLVFLSACSGSAGSNASNNEGNNAETEVSTDPSKQPEITLNVFSNLSNYAGEQPGWFGKIIKDKFNIKLNIISGGQQKASTMMASGDLGDIAVAIDIVDASKAGLLLDWNKDGLLDKYGQDIKKYAGQSLDAISKQYGGGKAIYAIGHNVGSGSGPSESANMTFGPWLRWDLYQKLGSPEIKTLEDYLSIMKQMKELSPKSDSGKPVYGFSLWSDWDGIASMNAGSIAALYGYNVGDGFNNSDLILTKADEAKWQGLIDEDSPYMRGLKFFFEANKMGLLDPDSLTQKFPDVANKYSDGQILFAQFPWLTDGYNTEERVNAGKGFAFVPFAEEQMSSVGFSPYGGNWYWSIGAKTKYPERVMQFMNWLFSPEGVQESRTGPKGLMWDIQDGKPTLTEFGYKAITNSVNMPDEYGGGLFKDGGNQINNSTLNLSTINPETGEPYDHTMWTSYLENNPNPVTKSWRDAMGALTVKEYVVNNNKVAVQPPYFSEQARMEEPSDIKQKKAEVGKVIKEYSWKMMFAKDDNQFASLKEDMVSKAKGLGYDEVLKWQVENYEKTVGAALKK